MAALQTPREAAKAVVQLAMKPPAVPQLPSTPKAPRTRLLQLPSQSLPTLPLTTSRATIPNMPLPLSLPVQPQLVPRTPTSCASKPWMMLVPTTPTSTLSTPTSSSSFRTTACYTPTVRILQQQQQQLCNLPQTPTTSQVMRHTPRNQPVAIDTPSTSAAGNASWAKPKHGQRPPRPYVDSGDLAQQVCQRKHTRAKPVGVKKQVTKDGQPPPNLISLPSPTRKPRPAPRVAAKRESRRQPGDKSMDSLEWIFNEDQST